MKAIIYIGDRIPDNVYAAIMRALFDSGYESVTTRPMYKLPPPLRTK